MTNYPDSAPDLNFADCGIFISCILRDIMHRPASRVDQVAFQVESSWSVAASHSKFSGAVGFITSHFLKKST